jgi:peptide/nickel transport system substrate-binding protein
VLSRNSIAKRDSDKISGTGPFHVVDWQPGKQLNLGANEEYWRGRPFLDGIEIEMGKSFRDQMTEFELHKADLIEVAPEQTHRFVQEGRSLTSVGRMELLALVFAKDASTPQEKLLRQALALSVERGSIRNVLLQGAGDPTAGILPTWISGYGFVFSTDADLAKARQLRDQVRAVPSWTLGYDNRDALSRVVAERVALNAKDAGLSVHPVPDAVADMRVVRIPIASGNPWVAFEQALVEAGLPVTKGKTESIEDLYTLEQSTLSNERIIPLFHLPVSYAASPGLRDWSLRIDGSWNLDRGWLEAQKP